jgi:hypothetical protein
VPQPDWHHPVDKGIHSNGPAADGTLLACVGAHVEFDHSPITGVVVSISSQAFAVGRMSSYSSTSTAPAA